MLLWIAVIGIVVWFLITYVPMPPAFKTLIVVIAVLVVLIWLISELGIVGPTVPIKK
jgi:hypothetical protein